MVVCSYDLREALRTAFILFPVLGLCWLLGLFIFGENLTYIAVIEWIFFVVVIAQGVLIFLLHCVINKEVLFTLLVFQSLFRARRQLDGQDVLMYHQS